MKSQATFNPQTGFSIPNVGTAVYTSKSPGKYDRQHSEEVFTVIINRQVLLVGF